MAKKTDKFSGILSSSTPSRNNAGSTNMILQTTMLQNIIEGDKPEYQYLPISSIELNPHNDYNQYDSDEDIRNLADDIKRNGLLHNIVVSFIGDGKYRLLSGERRLRAHRLLYTETNDPKYASIYALIRKGLSEIEEMIILDAANLNTRNSASDEKKFRKATARFVSNLKNNFDLSEADALKIAKQYANVTGTVVDRNVTIETDLHPSLLSLLDSEYISKVQAYEYARLSQDLQRIIADSLVAAKEKGISDFKKVNSDVSASAKNIRSLDQSLTEQESELDRIQEEEKNVKGMLANSQGEDSDRLNKMLKSIKSQKKLQQKVINTTKKSLDKSVNSLNSQVTNEHSQQETAPVGVINDGVTVSLKILEQVRLLKDSTDQLSALDLESKCNSIAESDKTLLRKKIKEIADDLNRLAEYLS